MDVCEFLISTSITMYVASQYLSYLREAALWLLGDYLPAWNRPWTVVCPLQCKSEDMQPVSADGERSDVMENTRSWILAHHRMPAYRARALALCNLVLQPGEGLDGNAHSLEVELFPEPGWTAYPPVCCGLHTASCSQCSCRQCFRKVIILLHRLPEQSGMFNSQMTSNLVEKMPFLHQRIHLTYADYHHIPKKVCMKPGK